MTSNRVHLVGLSGRFPKSGNAEDLFNNLLQRVDMVQPGAKTPRRYPRGLCKLPDQHGVINEIDKFDAGAFSIAPIQAKLMDPQVRILLEVVSEALFDAGLTPSDIKDTNAGVFVGCCGSDTHSMFVQRAEDTEQYVNTGNSLSLLANRLSFIFDIHGPSEVIDTACSSSMFAFEHAFTAIASGRCPLAIVAGCNLCLRPGITSSFNQLQMLSPSGRCAHMDASADGYARSESIAAVILTNDSAAFARHPYAHVVCAGTNNDGWKSEGLTFPSDAQQASLINSLYDQYRIDPHRLAWVEMHGTGTQGGDKRESSALSRSIFEQAPDRGPLRVRSLKSNMGHAEGASGVASVIATALAIHRRLLPGNLHFTRPNPDIPSLVNGQLVVVQDNVELTDPELRAQPLVGINSFGFGGANAHVVLEAILDSSSSAASSSSSSSSSSTSSSSAASSSSSPSSSTEHSTTVVTTSSVSAPFQPPVSRFVFVAGRTASHLVEVRTAVERALQACPDNESRLRVAANITALSCLLDAERWPHRQSVSALPGVNSRRATNAARSPKVFWCFTGMGSQWNGMVQNLLRTQPVFARSFTRGCAWLSANYPSLIEGDGLLSLIETAGEVSGGLAESSIGLVLTQLALVDCLREWGVPCEGVFGHSVGEISASYASGALSFDQALQVVAIRASALLSASIVPGQMLVTGLSRSDAQQQLCEGLCPGRLWVACVNSASNTTLAGHPDAIASALASLEQQGVFARVVPSCGYAFHSCMVEPAAPVFEQQLRAHSNSWQAPSRPWYSTSTPTAQLVSTAEQLSPRYFIDNLLSPVNFLGALDCLPENAIVLELGPSAILRTTVADGRPDLVHVGALRKPMPDAEVLEVALCSLFENGVSMRVPPHTPHSAHEFLPLIWDHSKTWAVPQDEAVAGAATQPRSSSSSPSSSSSTSKALLPITGKLDSVAALLEEIRRDVATQAGGSGSAIMTLSRADHEFLQGHTIQGTVLVPATGYLYFLREFAQEQGWMRPEDAVQFQNVHFLSATPLTIDRPSVSLEVHMAPSLGSFVLLDSETKTPVVRGHMEAVETPDLRGADVVLASTATDNDVVLNADFLYAKFGARGYEYQDSFQLLSDVRISASSERVVGQLVYRPGSSAQAWVPLMDGMLQALLCRDLALSPTCIPAGGGSLRLPTFLQKCVLSAPSQLQPRGGVTSVVVDPVTRAVYTPVARMEGLQTRAADVRAAVSSAPATIVHELEEWVPLHATVDIDEQTKTYSAAVIRAVTKRLANHGAPLPPGMPALLAQWQKSVDDNRDDRDAEAQAEAEERLAQEPWAVLLRLIRHMYEGDESPKGTSGAASSTVPLNSANARDRMFSFADYDKVYTDDPLFASFYRSALQLVVDVVLQAFGDESATTESLRIAEVGSGTGGTTVQIVPLLTGRSNHSRIEYIATDISASFFPALKDKAKAFASNVELQTVRWDLSEAPPRGVTNCHLLVADNVVHAVAPLHVALANLSASLIEGGFLLLREITFNHAGMMGVWGWLEETWPLDEQTPRDYGCLMSRQTWERALDAAGLSLVFSRSDSLFTSVLLAVKRHTKLPTHHIDVRGQLNPADQLHVDFYERVVGALADHHQQKQRGNVRLLVDEQGAPGLPGFLRCVNKEEGWTGRISGVIAPAEPAAIIEALPPVGLLLVEQSPATGVWGTRLHRPLVAQQPVPDPERIRYHLRQAEIGDFSSFQWTPMADADVQKESTRSFAVAYCALNFKDAMLASGRLQADGAHLPLPGFEFAGYEDSESGSGRRVMGISRYALSTRVYDDRQHDGTLTFDVPESWSLEEAASVPVVYLTAAYSLLVRARVGSPGGPESVLVHSGAGGVGIAALEIAFGLGLTEVYTTVSSQAKRDFLTARFPKLSSDHIFNSRSASFRDDVLRATHGHGVDCVLNSLAGDLLRATTEVVADGGCVVEIGRFDLQQNNSPFGMGFFEHNRCYHGVDLDQLFAAPPSQARRAGGLDVACAVFKDLLAKGIVRPLPTRVFPVANFPTAMSTLAKGQHIGKLLVDMRAATQAVLASPPAQLALFRSDAVYVVVGGLGGVGIALVDWMARSGARHFVISSRSAAAAYRDADKAAALTRWSRNGLHVTLTTLNASEYEGAVQMLALGQDTNNSRPVDGIFLLSMVLRDSLMVNISESQWTDVLGSKTTIADNLDRASRLLPHTPSFFVGFSSVAAGLGNAGQSVYAFANGCVEKVCYKRRADGLHGLAVQWGAVGDVGFVARHGDKVQLPGAMALQPIDSIFDSLATFIFYNPDAVVTTSYARQQWTTAASLDGAGSEEAGATSSNNAAALLEKVAQSLGYNDAEEAAEHTRSFVDEGMDSLTNTRVRNILKDALPGLTSRDLGAMTWQQLSEKLRGEAEPTQQHQVVEAQSDEKALSVWPPASLFITLVDHAEPGAVMWIMCGSFIDAQHQILHELVKKSATTWTGISKVVIFDWPAAGDSMSHIIAAWKNRPVGKATSEVIFAHSAAGFLLSRLQMAANTKSIVIGMPTREVLLKALNSIAQREHWSSEQKRAVYASSHFTAASSVPLMDPANPYLWIQFKILEDLTSDPEPIVLPSNAILLQAESDEIAAKNYDRPVTVLEGTSHDIGTILAYPKLPLFFHEK